MALDIQISAAELADSLGFTISDLTGSYGTGNTGGYGAPNADIADVLSCVATIIKPDPDTFLPSSDPSFEVEVDVYYGTGGQLPNTTGIKQTISAVDDLGYAETMQNGVYSVQITMEIDFGGEFVQSSNTYYMLVYNSLVCCITKQYLTINLDECGDCLKRDSAVWNTMVGQFYLNGAYYAWLYAVADATGDFSKCAEYLLAVTDICNNCAPCGC